jgi:hypothetical protein
MMNTDAGGLGLRQQEVAHGTLLQMLEVHLLLLQ